MIDTTTSSTELLSGATATIAQALGVPADKVTVRTGDAKNEIRGSDGLHILSRDDSKYAAVFITAEMDGAGANPGAAKDKMREGLATLKPVTEVNQILPDEQLAPKLADDIRKVAEGTNFKSNMLKWAGFNKDVAKEKWNLQDYAVNYVTSDAYGIRFNLRAAVDPNTEVKPVLEKAAKEVEAFKEDIRKTLTGRVKKYVRHNMTAEGKGEDDIKAALEKAEQQMGKLIISAKADEARNGVAVYIGTEEQSKLMAKDKPSEPGMMGYQEPQNAAQLKAENPVQLLKDMVTEKEREEGKSPQMYKALARAVLSVLPDEEFVKIAGRRDIKSAIAKSLMNDVLPKHPEKKDQIEAILHSDLFKDHDRWAASPESAETARPTAVIKKFIDEGDTVTAILAVPHDKVEATLKALADCAPQQECAPQPAVAERSWAAAEKPASNSPEEVLPMVLRPSFVERLKESLGFTSGRGAA